MNSQRFRAQELECLRAKSREVAYAVDRELPSEGWSGPFDEPMAILAVFPALRLKKGFVLKGYRFTSHGNGNGVVYAVPRSTEAPTADVLYQQWQASSCSRGKAQDFFPRSKGARRSLMSVIQGDGTPYSYLCASLFAREAGEYGAMWHGVSWGAETITDGLPKDRRTRRTVVGATSWQWSQVRPDDWAPVVADQGNRIIVTFYTYSGLGGETLTRTVDTFATGSYKFQTIWEPLAYRDGGYVP